MNKLTRRNFIKSSGIFGLACTSLLPGCSADNHAVSKAPAKPNLLFVFADQWRAQTAGYAGNKDVQTPHLDALAGQSICYSNAVSNCPVCSPFRASLMTGQYPLTHGVFLNDLRLNTNAVSFAQALNQAGYTTGYIGKWHLDGAGRSEYIPPERRQGFVYWKALECTHDYNRSEYYAGNDQTKKMWNGYDAFAQTDDAVNYLSNRAADGKSFALFLSWGPPHSPYHTAPQELKSLYSAKKLTLRKNVPDQEKAKAQKTTVGYYAHITALDQCLGKLTAALAAYGLDRNTIVVFTSDHGDMLHSQNLLNKQCPWDESIRIPFLIRCPLDWQVPSRTIDAPISAPDIMPTVLGLSGIKIPSTCEGKNLAAEVLGRQQPPEDRDALIMCPCPFGQWTKGQGGREYRGIRTKRYTYVRDLNGPWLLYDNLSDPFQQNNLIGNPDFGKLQQQLEIRLQKHLTETGDSFLPAAELIRRCGYKVDKRLTADYKDPEYHGQISRPCLY